MSNAAGVRRASGFAQRQRELPVDLRMPMAERPTGGSAGGLEGSSWGCDVSGLKALPRGFQPVEGVRN